MLLRNKPTRPRFCVVNTEGERFVIKLVTLEQIAVAQEMMRGQRPELNIISGRLAAGSGGFKRDPNTGREWSWHLVPETIQFAEVSIEVCQGRPSFVQEELANWLRLGQYCPVGCRIEREIQP